MTGSNHAVTGALIAVTVPQPAVAIPLAVASHFVLDMLPHYGDKNQKSWLRRHFNYVLATDAIAGLSFLLSLVVAKPAGWILAIVCALVAVAPDIIWLPYYISDLKGEARLPGWFARFSKWIQWGEHPWGIYIELVAFVGLVSIFIQTLR